jgi:hypothetical protein
MSPPTDIQMTRTARRSTSRSWLALLCCLSATLSLGAVLAADAHAGAWTLVSCTEPNGQPAPTDGWSTSSTGSVGPDSGDSNSCGQGGSLSAVTSGEAPQHPYEGPVWVFTAPAGSMIAGGTVTAALTSPHGQAWVGTPNPIYDSADVLANCQYNTGCGQSGTLSGAFPVVHPGGTKLYAIAVCVGPYEGATTCPANGGLDAGVYVSAADIELSNPATPAASGLGGTLLSPNARGTQDLTFAATDSGGPGVYTITVQIDGATVYSGTPDNNGGSCVALGKSNGVLMFDHSQPCKQSESVDLPINTATVADGQHTLKVTVEDAAQNRSVVYDGTITIQNAPTKVSSLGALPGPGTSAGISLGTGGPNGTGANEAAMLRLGMRRTITRTYAHRALRITGRLLDSQGHPISGANLDVIQQVIGASHPQVIAHVRTRVGGLFIARVPAGPSRLIEVAYRAFSADTSYSAQAKVQESVRAGIELTVSPRRTSSTGTILLTGQVDGPVPRQGVVVHLLVHYRGQWEPFRTPRTDAAGRFDVAYQFQGALGRFPFRGEVPGSQADFSFARGMSEVVDVATN